MEDRDPIIDTLLEELLGEAQPPDLSRRILGARDSADTVPFPSSAKLDTTSDPRSAGPRVQLAARSRASLARPRRRSAWPSWANAGILLASALILSIFVAWAVNSPKPNLADRPTEELRERARSPEQRLPPNEVLADDRSLRTTDTVQRSSPEDVSQPRLAPNEGGLAASPPVWKSPQFSRERPLRSGWSDEQIVRFTNDQLKASWQRAQVAVEELSDGEWFVRTARFLTGKEPLPSAVRDFVRGGKREQAVTSFMASREFSSNWSRRLADMLVGHTAQPNGTFDRAQLEDYLAQSLEEKKPYDQLAFELITAVGTNRPGENFNPATNFLLAQTTGHDASDLSTQLRATDKVCQLFLGQQLLCARCHEHPTSTVSQVQYYQMAAFFAQMQALPPNANGAGMLLNSDFRGSDGNVAEADVFFTSIDDIGISVYPQFLDGQRLSTASGRVSDIDRRAALAMMVVSSDAFSETAVNRLWNQAFGRGFTYPVDDIGDHNPPTHPALLKRLAAEFRRSGYDLRAALRWLTLSTAFQHKPARSSQPLQFATTSYLAPFPAARTGGEGVAPAQRFSPALPIAKSIGQLADSGRLGQPMALGQIAGGDRQSERAREQTRRRITMIASNPRLSGEEGGMLHNFAASQRLNTDSKIDHLFRYILGRRPTERELAESRRCLQQSSTLRALQEIGSILISRKQVLTRN